MSEISGGIGPSVETVGKVEARESREKVVEVFNESFSAFERYPADKLTSKQQAARDHLRAVKEKTIDKGKVSFKNRFKGEDGESYEQMESLPIEGLLIFLRERTKSGELSEEDLEKYIKHERILHRNSKEYYRISEKKEPPRKKARIQQEAERVSADPRLTKGNPHDDFLEANEILLERRELIFPKDRNDPPPPPIPVPVPVPIKEVIIVSFLNRHEDPGKNAAEQGEKLLREAMRRGSALNPLNWPRKIGLRILEDYWRQRLIDQTQRSAIKNTNSYVQLDLVRSSINFRDLFRRNIQNLNIDTQARSAEEKEAGSAAIKGINTGEQTADAHIVIAEGELKNTIINELIRPAINGEINTVADVQQRLREFVKNHQNDPQVQAIFGRDATQYGRLAEYFASDILEMTGKIKEDISAHKYTLEQLDEHVKIQLANTSWAAETQAHFNAVDRAVAWAQRGRIRGAILSPAVIGAVTSLATFAAFRGVGYAGKYANIIIPGSGMLTGAVIAAVRRNHDLKVDMASHRAERTYNEQIPANAPRREALERYHYDTASVKDLLDGGRGRSALGGDDRGLRELLKLNIVDDPNAPQNREAVIRRIAEIKERLDFSSSQKVDFVTFEAKGQVQQGRLQLLQEVCNARIALREAGMKDADINTLEARFRSVDTQDSWNKRFTQNKQQQDHNFAMYRLRNSIGAGVFGGAVGFGSGLATQEVLAEIGRHVPGASEMPVLGHLFGRGQTLGEKIVNQGARLVGHQEIGAPSLGGGGFNIASTKELFDHPRDLQVDDMRLSVGPDRMATFIDNQGHTVVMPPVHIEPDGKVAISGKFEDLPDKIKTLFGGLDHREISDPTYNAHEHILSAIKNHQETFMRHGDWNIHLNTGDGQMSMTHWPTGIKIDGESLLDNNGNPTIRIDSVFSLENKQLDAQAWTDLHKDLLKDGWKIDISKTPDTEKTINIIDHFFEKGLPKDVVKTDQFNKQWSGHVLRPDIVAATGMHTHNELTLHVGGDFKVLTDAGEVLRHGAGAPGDINFGGDIRGGLIDSHLIGIAAKEDLVLNELIRQSGGSLRLDQMMAVIDLGDGKQIMAPLDASGNFHLPQDLYRPTGELRGIHTIAAAFVSKDGHVVSAQDILSSGKVPDGSVVHSLASEKFPTGNITETIKIPGHEVFDFSPPGATEFTPPLPVELESAPIIPFPMAPRHPLEEMLILYGYGTSREGLGWVDSSEYERRRSKRLNADPYAKLDESVEVADYLSRMDPEYRRELEQMDNIIGAPMDSETRTVVTVPVFGEGKIIYKTLEQFLYQKNKDGSGFNPNLFEIIVFENDTEARPKDETENEIKRFKAKHPELKVHYAYKRWSTDDIANKVNTIGNGRRYNCDLALLRSNKRVTKNGELIVINNDADLEGITPKYIADVIEEFDSKERIDAIVGKRNLPDWALKKPNVRAGQRLWETFDSVMRHTGAGGEMTPDKRRKGWPGMIGENSAMRASIYAAVGGYGPRAKLAEDQNLGDMIRMARVVKRKEGDKEWDEYHDERVDYLNRLETVKNPRRYLTCIISGKPLIEMYNDYHENKDVRDLDNNALLRRIPDTFDRNRFQLDAEGIYQKHKRGEYGHLKDGEFDEKFKKTMDFMGVEYVIENGHVKITDAKRLLQRLNKKLGPAPKTTARSKESAPVVASAPGIASIPTQTATASQVAPVTPATMESSTPVSTETLSAELSTTELENVGASFKTLERFSTRTELESKEVYEKSLREVLRVLEGKNGIVELRDVPTIVIPDLHARRDFLVTVLNQEIKEGSLKGQKVYDLLKEGKINVVCLGDGMHSEQSYNWTPQIVERNPDGSTKKDASGNPIETEFGKKREEYNRIRRHAEQKYKAANPVANGNAIGDMIDRDPDVLAYWNGGFGQEYERMEKELVQKEMVRSLGMMKMIMDLEAKYPDSFHYIRGNHDDVMGGFIKFANESEMVREWIKNNFGENFLNEWAKFEEVLPMVARGKNFVASHAAPFGVADNHGNFVRGYTEAEIRNRDRKTMGFESVTAEDGTPHHRGLSWTDNTDADQFAHVEKAIPDTLKNLGLPENTLWVIGHRAVSYSNKYRSQLGGQLIQINDQKERLFAYIPNDQPFNPDINITKL